jgi:hypothetical protein
MSGKLKSVTVSTSADYLIGYERILDYLKDAQKECPKGVGLKKESRAKGSYVQLQFKLGDKRVIKSCGCNLTMEGITNALKKAHLVATALESFSSETEFLRWYDDVILEKNVVKNDLITFGEAIAKVESGYWEGYTKKRQKRDKENVSHVSIWYDAYGQYYKLLPQDTIVNLSDIMAVIDSKSKGSKTRQTCLSVMKKLTETIGDTRSHEELNKVDGKQTIYRDDLQSVSIEDFLQLREDVINIPVNDKRYNLGSRKDWLWVFSMQIVYGLRVHEVFAIQNIDKPFKTKDGVIIPALTEPSNKKMIAVVGDKTLLDTTTKTGYRLTVLMLPPTHPDLIEQLDIKKRGLPQLKVISINPNTIVGKYNKSARDRLESWSKFTQTHALRHLANLNGMMGGISLETRAMSLGHSPAMNDTVYKKRQTTKTTIDLFTKSDNQAIPLDSAVKLLKQMGSTQDLIAYTAAVYSVSLDKIIELLTDI